MNFEKVKNKNNLPIVLFFIIAINFIPLILPNMISKKSYGVGMLPMLISFLIEIILLSIFFYKKISVTKDLKRNLLILCIISSVLIIVQIKNYIIKDYNILDFANIACQFVNILFLFILVLEMEIEEEKIILFMKGILVFGLFSCFVNLILYYREILQVIGISGNIKNIQIKSFFSNKNQFAFYLFISVIANLYIILKENKLSYKISFLVLFLNLFLSMSRTGMFVAGVFLLSYLLFTEKIKREEKIKIITLILFFSMIFIVIINFINPELFNKLLDFENIMRLSGRVNIWRRGIDLLTQNPLNLLLGTGRFKGAEVLKFTKNTYTQFHNIYLDFLVTGGILELIFMMYIYYTVIRKIFKSEIDKKYKKLYGAMYISYAIYIFFESFGRFSIGAPDTLCFIFFITIPLIHANSLKNKETKEK